MNYRKAADEFVMTAFDLLDRYKLDPNIKYYLSKSLPKGYTLRITDRGRLVLCKVYRLHTFTHYTYERIIGHSFKGKYSQITYIGKLLAVYLENLQKDEMKETEKSEIDSKE